MFCPCVLFFAACFNLAYGQLTVSFDAAKASSAYPSAEFAANAAIIGETGYWCSSGKHVPGQPITWTGALSQLQEAVGVSISWAYSPGELRILTSADGGNFAEAIGWHRRTREEVSYRETLMFDAPQSVKALTLVMRAPKQAGFFGIKDVTLLVKPGPSMFVLSSSSGSSELCLVSDGKSMSTGGCLDAISKGTGDEVFSLGAASQLVWQPSGDCVTLSTDLAAATGYRPVLQKCASAAEVGDGRSIVDWTSSGMLRWPALGACLAAGESGVTAVACSEEGSIDQHFLMVSVPDFMPELAQRAQDSAGILKAATSQQESLLKKLQERLAACKVALLGRNSSALPPVLARVSTSVSSLSNNPALEAIYKMYPSLGVDMKFVSALITESNRILAQVVPAAKGA